MLDGHAICRGALLRAQGLLQALLQDANWLVGIRSTAPPTILQVIYATAAAALLMRCC
jgi:hypothetical protein